MQSAVKNLWDYTKYQLPEEYTKWRVGQEEIDHRLDAVAKSHFVETEEQKAERFDSVMCLAAGPTARWNRDNLLLFPGRGLADPALEEGVLGAALGDTITVETGEGLVTLTVKRILRRQPMALCDELIALENIDGVHTVEEYVDWYRETTQRERKEKLIRAAAGHIREQMLKNSEFAIDQEEAEEFCQDMVDKQFESLGGMENISLAMLDEDVLNPTEAGVKKKLLEMRLENYPVYVLNAWIVEHLTGKDPETVYSEGWKLIAGMNSELKTKEDVLQYAGESLIREFAAEKEASNYFEQYAEQFMEA